jgi:hypothetical protein
MKDSSWLINISISLVKKILQKYHSFSQGIAYPRDFDKGGFKRRKIFFAELLVKQLSVFQHPYLPGTKFKFQYLPGTKFLFQYLSGTTPFSKYLLL